MSEGKLDTHVDGIIWGGGGQLPVETPEEPDTKELEPYFNGLRVQDGICVCEGNDVASRFSDTAQNNLFCIEDTSWWFQYRADVIEQIAQKYFDVKRLTFDVGGGNGYTTYHMQKAGYPVVLLEPAIAACMNGKRRGLKTVVCGTLTEGAIRDGSIEQIMLLDVLEHIEDDTEFLHLIYRKLAPGGKVLLTVPAFKALWSSEDDTAGHYRRYKQEQLKETAQAAGFTVEYINYFFEFLFFPILFVRVWLEKVGLLKRSEERTEEEKRRITEGQFKERKGAVQWFLNILEQAELKRLLRGKSVKLGSSILCVLKRGSK